MRVYFTSCLMLLLLTSCQAQQKGATITQQIADAEKNLYSHSSDQQAWQQLYNLLDEHYTACTAQERKRLRAVLEKYGVWSTGTTYTTTEPGIKIVIKGQLINQQGKPVAHARVHVFQTDSHGYYTPLDSINHTMGEPDARLFCFLTTDSLGRFEIRTIRPGNYPLKYEGRTIPAHIHINTSLQGFRDQHLQVVFSDDPAMDAHWQQWAKEGGNPIITLDKTHAVQSAGLQIVLVK